MSIENDVKKIIRGTGSYDNVKFGNTVSITGDGANDEVVYNSFA